jgi:hypothetical protein
MPEKIKKITHECYNDMRRTTYPRGVFFVVSNPSFIGIDNITGELRKEEFENICDCMDWLRGRMR